MAKNRSLAMEVGYLATTRTKNQYGIKICISFDRADQELSNVTKFVYFSFSFWGVIVKKVQKSQKLNAFFTIKNARKSSAILAGAVCHDFNDGIGTKTLA